MATKTLVPSTTFEINVTVKGTWLAKYRIEDKSTPSGWVTLWVRNAPKGHTMPEVLSAAQTAPIVAAGGVDGTYRLVGEPIEGKDGSLGYKYTCKERQNLALLF